MKATSQLGCLNGAIELVPNHSCAQSLHPKTQRLDANGNSELLVKSELLNVQHVTELVLIPKIKSEEPAARKVPSQQVHISFTQNKKTTTFAKDCYKMTDRLNLAVQAVAIAQLAERHRLQIRDFSLSFDREIASACAEIREN